VASDQVEVMLAAPASLPGTGGAAARPRSAMTASRQKRRSKRS